MGRKAENEAGNVYGSLTVLSYQGEGKWKCRCLCGKSKNILGSQLRKGLHESCGCEKGNKANHFHLCRKCRCALSKENCSVGRIRKHDYICSDCHAQDEKSRRDLLKPFRATGIEDGLRKYAEVMRVCQKHGAVMSLLFAHELIESIKSAAKE